MQVAGFVLAGGKSTRMGRDKAWLEVDGMPMVERALRSLASVCAEVAIVGGDPELSRIGTVIPDDLPGCGPLSGIVAALERSAFAWNLFVATDIPLLPPEVWRSLIETAEISAGVCVMARTAGCVQPLCAAYARSAAPVLRTELEAGRWKVTTAIALAGAVEYLDFAEEHWFLNVNTPADLARLQVSICPGMK